MIIVQLSNSSIEFGPSKPCAICLYHMKNFGIDRVIYFDKGWVMSTVDKLLNEPNKHLTLGTRLMGTEKFVMCC